MKKMRRKLPAIKKDLSFFLSSEEAKITKKNAFKIGMGLLTILVISQILSSEAEGHSSSLSNPAGRGQHVSHSSHGSHGSHGSW